MLGIAVVSTFSIALSARPTLAENFICGALNVLKDQDCTAHAAPILNLPTDNAYLDSNDFNFSWQAVDDPSGVSYKVCVADSSTFVDAQCSDPVSDTTYPANTIASAQNQTNFWRVQAIDGAGNQSDWSAVRQFTIDTIDPTVGFDGTVALIGGMTTSADFQGRVEDVNLASYTITVTDPDGAITTPVSESAETGVNVTYTFDVSGRASGTYIVTLTGIDKAGRTGHKDVGIEVDNDGPDLSVTGGDVIIKSGSITPTVTATDPHDVVSYKWVADPNNSGGIIFDDTAKEPEFTPTIEGSYIFTLTATDGLGNTSSRTFQFGYAAELATLPLPVMSENGGSPDQNLPTAISPTANQTRDPREDGDSSDGTTAQVLGTTTGAKGGSSVTNTIAALTPTENGWKILGILWYWWLAAIVGVIAAWALLKRFLGNKSPQKS